MHLEKILSQPASDVWSMSLVGAELLTGETAWPNMTEGQILLSKVTGKLPECFAKVAPSLQDVLKLGLRFDRSTRLSALDMYNKLDGRNS